MRKAGILAAALLGASVMAAGPALADPPHCPPGHAKKNWCSPGKPNWVRDRDRDWEDRRERWEDRRARERAYEEGYRDGLREGWRVGERLPRNYRVVPDYDRFGWPMPGDGRGYVRYDDQYYLVNLATGLIIDILSR